MQIATDFFNTRSTLSLCLSKNYHELDTIFLMLLIFYTNYHELDTNFFNTNSHGFFQHKLPRIGHELDTNFLHDLKGVLSLYDLANILLPSPLGEGLGVRLLERGWG